MLIQSTYLLTFLQFQHGCQNLSFDAHHLRSVTSDVTFGLEITSGCYPWLKSVSCLTSYNLCSSMAHGLAYTSPIHWLIIACWSSSDKKFTKSLPSINFIPLSDREHRLKLNELEMSSSFRTLLSSIFLSTCRRDRHARNMRLLYCWAMFQRGVQLQVAVLHQCLHSNLKLGPKQVQWLEGS